MRPQDLNVPTLGEPRFVSPLLDVRGPGGDRFRFTDDATRLRFDVKVGEADEAGEPLSFERAGPRERIFFPPAQCRAAVVTCGGLCPGLNDVIRSIVHCLHHWYGVREVLGVPYGYAGLNPDSPDRPYPLTLEQVDDIHLNGGTILGSSRGHQEVAMMVDSLVRLEVNLLFTIGGDGTLRGAHEIAAEVARRNLAIAVVGVPKTIDNDIELVYRSFGFQTAVEQATGVLTCAHVEAKGVRHGVGLVKLMGRDSGFIAARAAMASGDVNYCLVPEVPLRLEGEHGFLAHLRRRLRERKHAVVAVAEGAGQGLIGDAGARDASGNTRYNDIGTFLKEEIVTQFEEWGEEVHVKYFDPSYIIRSVPANSDDSVFCADLGRYAVHAAMSGRTDMLVGYWHGSFTHVPLSAVAGLRSRINTEGNLWQAVLATTGQPRMWG